MLWFPSQVVKFRFMFRFSMKVKKKNDSLINATQCRTYHQKRVNENVL